MTSIVHLQRLVGRREQRRRSNGASGVASCATRRFVETLLRATDRCDSAVIEITEFDGIVEEHAVALPLEAVGKDHPSLGAGGNVGEIDGRNDTIADAQVDLALVRVGERVRFPELHGLILSHR